MKTNALYPAVLFLLLILSLPAPAADAPPIRLNTIGFLPDQEKRASVAATADFVAMTAMASRNLKPFDAPFAAKCQEAALKSWAFLAANPANHKADLKGFKTGDYQTNEIAINWNGALVYALAAFVEGSAVTSPAPLKKP